MSVEMRIDNRKKWVLETAYRSGSADKYRGLLCVLASRLSGIQSSSSVQNSAQRTAHRPPTPLPSSRSQSPSFSQVTHSLSLTHARFLACSSFILCLLSALAPIIYLHPSILPFPRLHLSTNTTASTRPRPSLFSSADDEHAAIRHWH
jgi:hypothetical protein